MDTVSIYDAAGWIINDLRYDCFMGRPIDEKILFLQTLEFKFNKDKETWKNF